MRKYSIPKAAYILLVSILVALCIGYTYAYFSSYYENVTEPELGYIEMFWYDEKGFTVNGPNGGNIVAIGAEKLKSDTHSQILAMGANNTTRPIELWLGSGAATVPAYCRVKIEATYIPSGQEEAKPCGEQWIQLSYQGDNDEPELITDLDWFYYDGYYYYGDGSTNTLKEWWDEGFEWQEPVADHIYLSPTVDPDVFGSQISIKLIVEAIQTTNGAISDPAGWGVTL